MRYVFKRGGGNRPKCGKHGVSKEEMEYALAHKIWEIRAPYEAELRFRAVEKTDCERCYLSSMAAAGFGRGGIAAGKRPLYAQKGD